MIVPVKINDSITKNFILDTGIGVNLISKSLCDRLKCKIKSQHTGKRMSGQEVTLPISEVASLVIGEVRQKDVAVGIFDMDQLMPGADIGGFLSLGFFKSMAFTIDDQRKVLIFESPDSLEKIVSSGTAIPVQIDQKGASTSIHMPLMLGTTRWSNGLAKNDSKSRDEQVGSAKSS